jgi:ribosomal protein S18 acetylase RimI-like enzyme
MIVTLRPALPEDEPFLYELYASTRAAELAVLDWSSAQREAFLSLQFRAQQAHYAEFPNANPQIIVEVDRAIGRLLVSRLPDEIRLVDVALLPEWRGRGIGSALLQQLLDEAARANKPVRLHVEKSNPARRLYRRLGFTPLAEVGLYYLMEWQPGRKTIGEEH